MNSRAPSSSPFLFYPLLFIVLLCSQCTPSLGFMGLPVAARSWRFTEFRGGVEVLFNCPVWVVVFLVMC